jgi:hypothetical protein
MCILNYQKTFNDYIDRVAIYIFETGSSRQYCEIDERFMRGVEDIVGIPETQADDFRRQITLFIAETQAYDSRRQIALFVGRMAIKKKVFRWNSNPIIAKAIEKYTKFSSYPKNILPFDLSWKSDIVYKIAEYIVKENKWGDLPVLADALEDANCACQVRLNHLRQDEDVEWCYVVAEILGVKKDVYLELSKDL